MTEVEYEEQLVGTRETATIASETIGKNLARYIKNEATNGRKHQLQFSLVILRSICVVITKNGIHYDLYCDIFEKILMPCIEPQASPQHWSRYLEHVRYYHFLMIDKKRYEEAARIVECLAGHANKLQSENDYKFILAPYSQHLYALRSQLQSDLAAIATDTGIMKILNNITALLDSMLQCNAELNFTYKDFLADFIQALLPKRTNNLYTFVAALPQTERKAMTDAFFKLLSTTKMQLTTVADEVQIQYQRHMDALQVFVNLDITDKLQTPLLLQYLSVCRELSHLQSDKIFGYILALFYYYVKMVYTQTSIKTFANSCVDLCQKFVNFIDTKCSESIKQQNWFTDVLFTFNIIFAQVQNNSNTLFKTFWLQMNNSVQCYTAHFEIIICCVRLAPNMAERKISSFECGCSLGKHLVISFAQLALSIFYIFLANVNLQLVVIDETNVSNLNKVFIQIIEHAINVIDSLSCMNSTSNDLKVFCGRFIKVMDNVKTTEQSNFCIKLAEYFAKIRNRFTGDDWFALINRLVKVLSSTDNKLTQDIRCCYIATLLLRQSSFETLRSNLHIFYSDQINVENGKCILQVYKECKSPLKTPLNEKQKRLLLWYDMQYFLKYAKGNAKLQQSLMQHTHSQYDHVILLCGGKLQPETVQRLNEICTALRAKSRGLKRLEQLIYAHASSALLQDQLEILKNKPSLQTKNCVESNLEELFQLTEVLSITMANEVRTVKLAQQALNAFQMFFNKADAERVSSDEAIIDWECVVDDLLAIAQFLQLFGYMEYATEAWRLHYRITSHINDFFSSCRSMAYFCEHFEYFDNNILFVVGNESIALQTEINSKLQSLLSAVENLKPLSSRKQNFVLICMAQLGYYYARNGRLSEAELLLQLVRQKHEELTEREDKYDIVLLTMDVIKFRILWQDADSRKTIENETKFYDKCLLYEIDVLVEGLKVFSYTSPSDGIPFLDLLINVALEIAECTGNRLCEYVLSGVFPSVLKTSIQFGSALRLVQILTMWAWVNLQMEDIREAQNKLKLIDCVIGENVLKNVNSENQAPLHKSKALSNVTSEMFLLPYVPSMETVRKIVPVYSSPTKENKITLCPTARKRDLKDFLKSPNLGLASGETELMQWINFSVGCLNARLYYLIEEYEPLQSFYEQCLTWLQSKSNRFLPRCFHVQRMLCMQHYANYLRRHRKYDRALICLEDALIQYEKVSFNVDTFYRSEFLMQLLATKVEMTQYPPHWSKPRRALEFNVSPTEERSKAMPATTGATGKVIVATNAEKKSRVQSKQMPFTLDKLKNYSKNNDDKSKRNKMLKTLSSSSLETSLAVLESSTDNDFNMCQLIEIEDSDDGSTLAKQQQQVKASTTSASEHSSRKKVKRQTSREANTPKSTVKPKRVVAKRNTHINALNLNAQPMECIVLDDSFSGDNEELQKQQINLAEECIIGEMQKLEISKANTAIEPPSTSKVTEKKPQRRQRNIKNSTTKPPLKAECVQLKGMHIFQDAMCIDNAKEVLVKSATTAAVASTAVTKPKSLIKTRQRKVREVANENIENIEPNTIKATSTKTSTKTVGDSKTISTTTTTISTTTRRKQKS